jgi:hypothetical protein
MPPPRDVRNSLAKGYTQQRDLISTIRREECSWDNHALQQSSRLWFRWTLEPTIGVPAGDPETNRFVTGHTKEPGLNRLSSPWMSRKTSPCASASIQRLRRSVTGRTRRSDRMLKKSVSQSCSFGPFGLSGLSRLIGLFGLSCLFGRIRLTG